jgi:hypothetical protein
MDELTPGMKRILDEMRKGNGQNLTHTRTDGWWVGFFKAPLGSDCRRLIAEGLIVEVPTSGVEEYTLPGEGST